MDLRFLHRYFRPRTVEIDDHGQRSTTQTLREEEYTEYTATYLHYVRYEAGRERSGPKDIYPTWSIKGNVVRWLEFEGSEYPSSYTDSDSDSEFEPNPETDATDTETETVSDDVPETLVDHEMT